MATGIKTRVSKKDKNLFHTTNYDDNGRHSFDWDPITGNVTRDHSVSNENQDVKIQWSDSNIWEELERESK